MLSFRTVDDDTAQAERLVSEALPWIIEAGRPYYDLIFGGIDTALTFLYGWACRATSEIAVRRVTFLMADSEFAGGFIALTGRDLRAARRADTVALLTSVSATGRDALMRRLASVSHLMTPVEQDEYYLSKLGVAQAFRGKRLSRVLLDRFLEQGARCGYMRYCLDVHADNEPAIRCYRSAGFEIRGDAQSRDGGIRYYSMSYTGPRL